jgi:hypothetical protein
MCRNTIGCGLRAAYSQNVGPLLTFGAGFAVGSWLNYDCDWGAAAFMWVSGVPDGTMTGAGIAETETKTTTSSMS